MNIRVRKAALSIPAALIAIVCLAPLLVTVGVSFLDDGSVGTLREYGTRAYGSGQSGATSKAIVAGRVTLLQYYRVFIDRNEYLFYFWNSVFLVAPIVAGQLLVAAMAAYGFTKMRFRYRELIFFLYIITMLMPFQVTLVPNYLMARRLGLLGSYSSIILPGIFATFGVFLLRQFMMYIPNEYSEAAKVAGANHLHVFGRIIVPLLKPGIAALAILLFIDYWNMVEQPLIFLKDAYTFPLSVALSVMRGASTGPAFAASVLYMTPMILMFLYGKEYLIQGVYLSGIKG